MNVSDIMRKAPRYLTTRYGSLNSYVWEKLFPQSNRNKIFSKIKDPKQRKEKYARMKSLVDEATLVIFIFVTRKTFIEGAIASKETVDTLKELGINKFCLGKTEFAGRNKNVVLGDKLAKKLLSLIDVDMRKLLLKSKYISEIINHYGKKKGEGTKYSYLFDRQEAIIKLKQFFKKEKTHLVSFGNVVNQVFEAYTFASTIKWYEMNGWKIDIINPIIKGKKVFQLKFSTRGAPNNYSFAVCKKEDKRCQIRHQLRVATKSYKNGNEYNANMCCDIVILDDIDLRNYLTDEALPNKNLISFGEVKHMSAFAELVAGFIGIVYELQPRRLRRTRISGWQKSEHISPYLNVSGLLQPTAKGINETVEKRKYDVDIYHYENKIIKTLI